MANYYVSTTGNDTTGNGLSPATAWRTIGKAIGPSPAITLSGSGDTLYIAPGVYREQVSFAPTPSSSSPFSIVGDATGAIFGVSPGVVEMRGWTDDFTAMSGATLSIASSPYVTLQGMKILGGTFGNGGALSVTGSSDHLTIQDCEFVGYVTSAAVQIAILASGGGNVTIDRCDFIYGTNAGLNLRPQLAASEYNISTTIRNCRFIGRGDGFNVSASGGSGTGLATGIAVQNCAAFWCNNGFRIYTPQTSTMTSAVVVQGCEAVHCATGINANNTSQVAADYNMLHCSTNLTNVNAGTHSKSDFAPALDFGDYRLTGTNPRPFGEPSPGSPVLAFVAGGSPPTVDMNNQTRPATPACGPLEIDTFSTGGSTTYIFQTEG